jgi:hypothetical protein
LARVGGRGLRTTVLGMREPTPVRWLYKWPRSGSAQFRLGRVGSYAVAEWIGRATLRTEIRSGESELVSADGSNSSELADFLGREISALLGHLRGEITLHSSCVAYQGVAMAFIGESLVGKSTMAALLCRDGARELVSDDLTSLRVEGSSITALPSDSAHSLRPDVAKAFGLDPGDKPKLATAAMRCARDAVRLDVIVSLVFDESARTPVLRPMYGAEAFTALSLSTVRFVLDEPDILRKELDKLSRLAREARCYELRRSRDLTNMDAATHEAASLFG